MAIAPFTAIAFGDSLFVQTHRDLMWSLDAPIYAIAMVPPVLLVVVAVLALAFPRSAVFRATPGHGGGHGRRGGGRHLGVRPRRGRTADAGGVRQRRDHADGRRDRDHGGRPPVTPAAAVPGGTGSADHHGGPAADRRRCGVPGGGPVRVPGVGRRHEPLRDRTAASALARPPAVRGRRPARRGGVRVRGGGVDPPAIGRRGDGPPGCRPFDDLAGRALVPVAPRRDRPPGHGGCAAAQHRRPGRRRCGRVDRDRGALLRQPASALAGDRETGVTLIQMDAGLDTGPIVAVERWR